MSTVQGREGRVEYRSKHTHAKESTGAIADEHPTPTDT